MCRNIKTLHNFEPPATDEEIHLSSLQFVRKLSGFTRPSHANQVAFDRAVEQVSKAARARSRRKALSPRGEGEPAGGAASPNSSPLGERMA
jgi:hypothetical protein